MMKKDEQNQTLPRFPEFPPFKHIKEIKQVLEEIRAINKKLQAFEGGFISEEGIKVSYGKIYSTIGSLNAHQDREWYKHKGVAPGKWLGYGATTVSRSGPLIKTVD